jgi:hypothetical protein
MSAEDQPLISASFLTLDPNYHRSETIRAVLEIITSSSDYTPESIAGGENKVEHQRFIPESTRALSEKWERVRGLWDLKGNRPYFLVTIVKSSALFEPLMIHVERDFLNMPEKLNEFVIMLKKLYDVIHPAYGNVIAEESKNQYDSSSGRKQSIGINLKRALPDIYWGNFLGPEYVQMFGLDRILSAPVHSVERLSDGGAFLKLSESPFDYTSDIRRLEKRKQEVKKYLGIEAFDTGDVTYKGRVPTFRFLEEKERDRQVFSRKGHFMNDKSDWLSTVRREEWEEWVKENRSLADDFTLEMEAKGLRLDSSRDSLRILDNYIESLRASKLQVDMKFLEKMSAYVTQLIIRETGARLSFGKLDDIPTLRVGGMQVSPLAKGQKAILEDEKLEPWYRFITEEVGRGNRTASI